MRLENKKILITGAAGFLGSKIVETLLDEKAYCLLLDKNHEQLNPGAQAVPFGAPVDPSTTNWLSKVQKTDPNVPKQLQNLKGEPYQQLLCSTSHAFQ